MAPNKPYTSQEIAAMVERWQFCRFFDKETEQTIISIPYHELYRKGSQIRCSPEALDKIKAELTNAYDFGTRKVGLLCPYTLKLELLDLALSVTTDPEWEIYPLYELTYLKNSYETQKNLWDKALFATEVDSALEKAEKQICDDLGFTDEILDELFEYQNVPDVKKLPPHLRTLFGDGGQPEEDDKDKK